MHSRASRFAADLPLLSLAIFTIAWAVTRACLQSITQDEAATFRHFVGVILPNHWAPHSNNHVLNSLLMRFSTTIFGVSQFTVRMPALLGAIVYVGSCYALCRWLTERRMLRVVMLACMISNPYLSDFYVAARGYSMANGFLICAIAVVARLHLRGAVNEFRHWMIASTLMGLSFAANFSFAFLIATTWAALFLWTLHARPRTTSAQKWRLFAASTLPAAIVVSVLVSWTLLHWPKGELWDGAHSLGETFRSVMTASLHEPHTEAVNPLVVRAALVVKPFLIPVISAAALLLALLSFARRRRLEETAQRRLELALVVSGALAVSILLHWAAFQFFGLLLPRNRFASYLIPFWTLTVIAVAAAPLPVAAFKDLSNRVLPLLLTILAVYYGVCLRSVYFYEWFSDADTKEIYYVLAHYNHTYGVTAVPSKLPATDCLEFYRRTSGRESLAEFTHAVTLPEDAQVYVVYESAVREWIAQQGLKIVYRGRVFNDVVVAIRPALEGAALHITRSYGLGAGPRGSPPGSPPPGT